MKFSSQQDNIKENSWWKEMKLRLLKRYFPKRYQAEVFKEYERIWAEERQEGEQVQDKISAYEITNELKEELDKIHNEKAMVEAYRNKRKEELIEELENTQDEERKEAIKWLLRRY